MVLKKKNKKFAFKVLILGLAVIGLLSLGTSAYAVIYVDASSGSGGDGASWGTAYNNLEAAFSGGETGVEIWVAQGTYTPSNTIYPKEFSKIYGGFAGTEESIDQRNVENNTTIISGATSNKRVFIIWNDAPDVRVDGLTIQNSIAITSGNNWTGYGGAIFVDQVYSEIANCTFSQNSASYYGGAVYINRAAGLVENCIFESNISQSGGALAGWESGATVYQCEFTNNQANQGSVDSRNGGAIWFTEESPKIINSTFSGNSAQHSGGAIDLWGITSALISGCTFTNNEVNGENTGGGAVACWKYNTLMPVVTIENCDFQGNTSGLEGGGVYSQYCDMLIKNSKFRGNIAENGGAIMLDFKLPDSEPSSIENCFFFDNTATATGGAIRAYARSVDIINSVFAFNSSYDAGAIGLHAGGGDDYDENYNADLSNCVLYGNTANNFGGGMLNTNVPMLYINNSIFWENTGGETIWDSGQGDYVGTHDVFNASTSSMTTRYTDMKTLNWEHGSFTPDTHTGSFSSDPLFVDPNGEDNEEGTLDDNFQLSGNSPCLDRADGDYAPDQDIIYTSRVDLKKIPNLGAGETNYADIGAYELLMLPVPLSPIYILLLSE